MALLAIILSLTWGLFLAFLVGRWLWTRLGGCDCDQPWCRDRRGNRMYSFSWHKRDGTRRLREELKKTEKWR